MNIGQVFFVGFIILIVASLDAFALGFGYGTKKVRIPLKQISIVSVICSIFILASLLLGYFLGSFINPDITRWLSFGIFMTFGLARLVAWFVNRKKIKHEGRLITIKEVILLAVILSIDGIGIGLGSGLYSVTLIFIFSIFALSIFTEIFIFKLGQFIGNAMANKLPVDLGWVGGTLLILVAIAGLFMI